MAGFIVCVGPLGYINYGADFCLRQIVIFSKVADSCIYLHFYHRENYNLEQIILYYDFLRIMF